MGLTDDIELPKRPTTKELFDQYLSEDLWPILSQVGSHPGFQQIYLFFVEDPAARKVNIRWSGAEVQRATFIASALDVYARFPDLVARALQDDDWARQVFTEVKAMAPLLLEVRQRWYAHWQGA